MNFAIRFGVWITTWAIGCGLFDLLLQLSGPWLMAGGAITYMVCSAVNDVLKRAQE